MLQEGMLACPHRHRSGLPRAGPCYDPPVFFLPGRNPFIMRLPYCAAPLLLLLVSAASSAATTPVPPMQAPPDPYPSTYKPRPARPVLITHATVLTATGTGSRTARCCCATARSRRVGHDSPGAGRRGHVDAQRQVGDARHHRRPLAPRRLRDAGGAGATTTATRRPIRSPPTCGPSTRSGRRIRSSRSPSPAA